MSANEEELAAYEEAMAGLVGREHETLVPNILVCVGICAATSVVILGLRVWSRICSGLKFASHDYLAFAGFVFLLGQVGTMGGMTRHGLGRHANIITENEDIRAIQIVSQTFCLLPVVQFPVLLIAFSAQCRPRVHVFRVHWLMQAEHVNFVHGHLPTTQSSLGVLDCHHHCCRLDGLRNLCDHLHVQPASANLGPVQHRWNLH